MYFCCGSFENAMSHTEPSARDSFAMYCSLTNLPACVNLSTRPSVAPFPPIHTIPLPSTVMPWFDSGHSKPSPGPPQDDTRLPAASNSRTGGAPLQHSPVGGLSSAPRSLLFKLAELRWMIQM